MQNTPQLKDLLEQSDKFLVAVEVETSRGLAMEDAARKESDFARQLSEFEGVDVVALTDNPGGNPHIRPEVLGQDLLYRGREVIINVSCKDYNRNGVESRLWALGSTGFKNILALSGDYPTEGYGGQAQPVFDMDSAGLLKMISEMNTGMPLKTWRSVGRDAKLAPTEFYPGCAVNPFKLFEGELMTQFMKLELKVRTGAKWAITQIGYDARKWDELIRYTRLKGFQVPMFGSVFILTAPAAGFFNRWGIPGVAVNNDLHAVARKQAESRDRGRTFFTELAAKQMAILKGLGYRGVYLSGRPRLPRLSRVLEIEKSFAPDDWKQFAAELHYPQDGEFYYFEEGENPGLSSDSVNQRYMKSLEPGERRKKRFGLPLAFRGGKFVHDHLFDNKSRGYKLGHAVYTQIEKSKTLSGLAHGIEQMAKVPVYSCQDCGDCSLPDIAYLCPESQCVKNQRNGPCGGTKAGYCEVLDKQCIWLRAYDRLKPLGEEQSMLQRPIIFKDASLRGTSAWANTFMERDHHSQPVLNED
jgi:methylenetetrahydrofolate reductase (NADPH)